jgi:hypothetical protein
VLTMQEEARSCRLVGSENPGQLSAGRKVELAVSLSFAAALTVCAGRGTSARLAIHQYKWLRIIYILTVDVSTHLRDVAT